jgi:ATP-dependent Clp protease ATP-binding subunit ClpC
MALDPVERLSDDCVDAVRQSHYMASAIGLQELPNEILLAGIVARPERAAYTLQRFAIDADDVKDAAVRVIRNNPNVVLDMDMDMTTTTTVDTDDDDDDDESDRRTTTALGNPVNGNANDNANDNSRQTALPFGDDAKTTLNRACQIASRMESQLVRSEHVLLALMGYNNGDKIVSSPVDDVLTDLFTFSTGTQQQQQVSVFEFCEQLVNALPNTPVGQPDTVPVSSSSSVRDNVVIGGGRPGQTNTKTNTLQEVGVDLTQLALDGKLDMVFGRDKEIRSALRTLGRRRKNNPCLIGDPGVGKTAVAEAIAQVLANGLADVQQQLEQAQTPQNRIRNLFSRKRDQELGDDAAPNGTQKESSSVDYQLPPCPASLKGARLISIELAGLVAGTANRGDFEQKIKNLVDDASSANVILFIDEIHNLIGTGGGGDGAMNAANILKPALARGDLRILGATTTPEYRRYIEKDGALERRFQPQPIKEPTVYDTLDILATIAPRYEAFHGVEYTYNALLSAATLSNRYINDRFLPDKAIDLLDEAGSMLKMSLEATTNGDTLYVTEDSIAQVISELSGIPIGKLDTGEKARLRQLEQDIQTRIKGQGAAVRTVAKAIRRSRSGMRDGTRPVASLLFCGPTGVGKTELCKALAETYYGQEKDIIRLDMSEYMDRFSTSRLIGAPPGYVGYEEGGQLTEAVRRAPHSVILFDELEKAHEDVLNLLLQIMDEGQLTDGKGRTVSFRNNIVVMTSNIGSQDIIDAVRGETGSNSNDNDERLDDAKQELTSEIVKGALEAALRPELLNRIDEIVVFSPLSYENLKDIATNLIAATVARAEDDQRITMRVSDNIAEIVTRDALSVASIYGARPIRRAVQRYLEDTMAEAIMSEFVDDGDDVSVNLKDPNGDKRMVEITRLSDGKSILINVDDDAGMSATTAAQDLEYQASYGDLPELGDDPPKRQPGDTFQ